MMATLDYFACLLEYGDYKQDGALPVCLRPFAEETRLPSSHQITTTSLWPLRHIAYAHKQCSMYILLNFPLLMSCGIVDCSTYVEMSTTRSTRRNELHFDLPLWKREQSQPNRHSSLSVHTTSCGELVSLLHEPALRVPSSEHGK